MEDEKMSLENLRREFELDSSDCDSDDKGKWE
jgi:hypothetical protein